MSSIRAWRTWLTANLLVAQLILYHAGVVLEEYDQRVPDPFGPPSGVGEFLLNGILSFAELPG